MNIMRLILLKRLRLSFVLLVATLMVSSCSSSGSSGTDGSPSEDGSEVISTASPPSAVQANLELVSDKTFRVSWLVSDDADFYKILENPDGISGFSAISNNLDSTTLRFDHRIALYDRINARYIVQACNSAGCTDSDEQLVAGNLESAIGILRPSNLEGAAGISPRISIDGDGDTLVVGTSALVAILVRENGSWSEHATLSSGVNSSISGAALSLSADGNTLVIGSNLETSAAIGVNGDQQDPAIYQAGAVHVYSRSDDAWQYQAHIKAGNPMPVDQFGSAVSVSADGNTLLVGAPSRGSRDAGAAYLFSRNNGVWQEQAFLLASNARPGDRFGETVAISDDGNTLAIGATGEDSVAVGVGGDQYDLTGSSNETSGAVYVFGRDGDAWPQQAYVKAPEVQSHGFFGDGISLSGSGDVLVARGHGREAVYLYSRRDDVWQYQTSLPGGNSISLSDNGRVLAIGDRLDTSAATGVNGDPYDTSIDYAGAVRLYKDNAGSWSEHAYIKAATAGRNFFGKSVALSADGMTLAVGGLESMGVQLY